MILLCTCSLMRFAEQRLDPAKMKEVWDKVRGSLDKDLPTRVARKMEHQKSRKPYQPPELQLFELGDRAF